MKNLTLVFTIFIIQISSATAAVECLEGLEKGRNLIESKELQEPADSEDFEHLSRKAAKLLPQTLTVNPELTLFSLLRTRHHFFGMPRMVSEFGATDSAKILVLVDALAVHAWHREEVEDLWRIGTEESCYDSKILEAIQEDFEGESGLPLSREFLKTNKLLLDKAFSIYEIFAPKMNFRQAVESFTQDVYRGWTIEKGSGALAQLQGEFLSRVKRDESMPINSLTSHGVKDREMLRVNYYFVPWMTEKEDTFAFSFVKDLGKIKDPIQVFLYPSLPPKAQERLENEFAVLRSASYLDSQQDELDCYRAEIRKGTGNLMIYYTAGLLLKSMGRSEEAYPYFKFAADRGLPHAQDHCGLHLQETNPTLARLYFKAGAGTDFSYANFHYGDCLKDGIGGKKDREKALIFLKKAADSGHPYAQYDYGFLSYQESREYLEKASKQGVREAKELLPRLPTVS
jgi:hypothetical protein